MQRRNVIFTTMKNEGPFMLEWVAHHMTLGFDGIVIFTNDCVDGTTEIADRLTEMGLASHYPNRIRGTQAPQHKALNRARSHPWVLGADWLICMDVDEFINFRTGSRDLAGFLNTVGDVDAVSLTWKLFGCGGVERYQDTPLTEQMFLADHETNYHNGRAFGFKTLFRNNGKFERFHPHRPKYLKTNPADIRWADCGGNIYDTEKVSWRAWPGFSHEHARLHHYSVRSIESFLVKRDRGRTNHVVDDQAKEYWADMNQNRTEDRSILPLSERARPMLETLKSDPVLKRLHQSAVDWHLAKIKELHARTEWEGFYDWLRENATRQIKPAMVHNV